MISDQNDMRPSRLPRAEVDVSVALCTHNGSRWVTQFLESLGSQEQLPDELVVQDDRSTDNTVELVLAFAERAPFEVRLETNDERLGSTANFAQALARSRGRLIALADQDDIWYPAKLRLLVAEFKFDPTITMVFSNADLIGEDGRLKGSELWDTRLVGHILRRHSVVPEELLARRALTTGCTMAVRRRAVEAALPFPAILADPSATMRHDRWLSLVSAAVGTVRAIPEPLMGFRVHPGQETGVLVEGQLLRALSRAAIGVLEGHTHQAIRGHLVRAAQLDTAANRAENLGDFEGAETLRQVGDLHRFRVQGGASIRERLGVVARGARLGVYDYDMMGLGAVLADIVRSMRSPNREMDTAAT